MVIQGRFRLTGHLFWQAKNNIKIGLTCFLLWFSVNIHQYHALSCRIATIFLLSLSYSQVCQKKDRNHLSFGHDGFARKSKVFTVFENKRCKNTFWAINLYDKVVPHALWWQASYIVHLFMKTKTFFKTQTSY